MQVKQIEGRSPRQQRPSHGRRPIEPAQRMAREVRNLYAFEVDRPAQRHVTIARAIHAGGEDVNVVAAGGESPAKRMHRLDRPAVAHGRKIGRDDVKQAQMLNQGLAVCPSPIA